MVGVLLAGDAVLTDAVMRQNADGLLIAARTEFVDVIGKYLSDAFDIIKHADFLRNPLNNPDRHCVGSGKITRPDRQSIGRSTAPPPGLLRSRWQRRQSRRNGDLD